MKKKLLFFCLIIMYLLLVISSVSAVKIDANNNLSLSDEYVYVNADGTADYTTIQEAIDNTKFVGEVVDAILVYPGTYNENIVIYEFHTKIISIGGPETTIINGDQTTNVIKSKNSHTQITGFTIKNGGATYSGVLFEQHFGKLFDCIVKDNRGIGIKNAEVIKDCVIKNNGYGAKEIARGGIVARNTFLNNDVGLDISGCKSLDIYYNTFKNNRIHAVDQSNYYQNMNVWGGNFWDDIYISDRNDDGIVDSPRPFELNYDFYPRVSEDNYPNLPPFPPFVNVGRSGLEKQFLVYTIDVNNDNIFILIDWGDGTPTEGWQGPYESENTVDFIHDTKSRHKLTFRVKDSNDVEGFGTIISFSESKDNSDRVNREFSFQRHQSNKIEKIDLINQFQIILKFFLKL